MFGLGHLSFLLYFSGNLPFACSKCGRRFLTRHAMVFHMEAHLSKRYECAKCGTKFVHQRSYEQHQRAMCLGHRKRIAARKRLMRIPDVRRGEGRLVCVYCQKECSNVQAMEIHVTHSHPEHTGDMLDAYVVRGDGMNVTSYVNKEMEVAAEQMIPCNAIKSESVT